jgi:virulence factor BrkB
VAVPDRRAAGDHHRDALACALQRPSWRGLLPGALLATALWVVSSGGFAFFTATFDNYNKTWGSLSTVIVTLVWLWLTSLALLLVAELNAEAAPRARNVKPPNFSRLFKRSMGVCEDREFGPPSRSAARVPTGSALAPRPLKAGTLPAGGCAATARAGRSPSRIQSSARRTVDPRRGAGGQMSADASATP